MVEIKEISFKGWTDTNAGAIVEYTANYWSSLLGNYMPSTEYHKINIDIKFEAMEGTTLGYCLPVMYYAAVETMSNGNTYNTASGAELKLKLDSNKVTSYLVDMTITFNSNALFSYEEVCNTSSWDFYTTLLHEMSHGMGFYSFGSESGWGSNFTAYDALMNIDHADYAPGMTITIGSPDLGLEVYNPEEWVGGSSVGHLSVISDPDAVMSAYLVNGVQKSGFSEAEIALMRQMGWDLTTQTIPEPTTATLSLLGLGALLLRRRRVA